MPRKPVSEAIFLGRGLTRDTRPSFMNWGFSPIDKDGNLVEVDNIPTDADLVELKLGAPALIVGKRNYMPFWDDAALRGAVASENFAHPKMEEQINAWLDAGIEGEALYQKVKEAKGLITLKDLGFEELPPAEGDTPASDTKQGG
jgi:hypothetical protein